MPLTIERDGLFRGRRGNREAWYIVDPGVEGGTTAAITNWREHYAATNRPRWQCGVRAAVFIAVWLAVIGAGWLLAFVVIPGADAWRGFIVVGALVLGAPAAGRVMAVVFPPSRVPPYVNSDIVPVPLEIEDWADDDRPASELWPLVRDWHQLDQVMILHDMVDEAWWEDTGYRRPHEAVATLLEPVLREQWVHRRDRLIETATAVGFPLSSEMLGELPRFAERRER